MHWAASEPFGFFNPVKVNSSREKLRCRTRRSRSERASLAEATESRRRNDSGSSVFYKTRPMLLKFASYKI